MGAKQTDGWQVAWQKTSSDFTALPFQSDQLVQVIKVTPQLTGTAFSLELSNRFGSQAVVFNHVWVARDARFQHECIAVTQCGNQQIVLPPHTVSWLDDMTYPVTAGEPIYVQLVATRAQTYVDYNFTILPGLVNAAIARRKVIPSLSSRTGRKNWYCLTGLAVKGAFRATTVMGVGDSVIEVGTITDALITHYMHRPVVVTNAATAGRQLLADALPLGKVPRTFGESLLHQLRRLTAWPPVMWCSIGANDLMLQAIAGNQVPTSQALIAGLKRIQILAQQHATWLIMSTLPPFVIDRRRVSLAEQRQLWHIQSRVNEWLRNQPHTVDVFTLLADPQTGRLRREYDLGDRLHPNKEAGERVAAAVQFVLDQYLS
ncbi:hypothetical protein ACI3E1_05580 [Ligilactobacillus sp. LYQ139]|uniref:hypothetical protein n=1 Tax=Ligilactobacillus sp. LYQ139 TaxID=3378800 RepID=UPI003854DA36